MRGGGGIAGPCCERWDLPDITVYADGRVMVPDEVDDDVRQVPALRQSTVSRTDLTDLLADTAEASLLDADVDLGGDTMYCDMSSTSIVLADATATHELSVVGLGAEDSPDAEGLTADQRARRQALLDLRSRLDTVARHGDDGYTPDELAVYASATDAQPGVEPTPCPLDEPLTEATPIDPDGRCLHITTNTPTVLAAAQTATNTIWSSAGRTWNVLIRPLLAHQHDCP